MTTNAEFLAAIFRGRRLDETTWTLSFAASPKTNKRWRGKACQPDEVADETTKNAYFSVATLRMEMGVCRSETYFSRLFVVVIDDVESKIGTPTWRIETSKGNFQQGYVLATPIDELDQARRLHHAIAKRASWSGEYDANGNNLVRYVRLPNGVNTKSGDHFACRLVDFNPELVFTLEELASCLGLNFEGIVSPRLGVPHERVNTVDAVVTVDAVNPVNSSYLKVSGGRVARSQTRPNCSPAIGLGDLPARCIPEKAGARDRALFFLARELRIRFPDTRASDWIDGLLTEWHKTVYDTINTKAFEVSESAFINKWDEVKYLDSFPDECFRGIDFQAQPPSELAELEFKNNAWFALQLCHHMAERSPVGEFFLSVRTLARLLDIEPTSAHNYLTRMVKKNVIVCIDKGNRVKAATYRWSWPHPIYDKSRLR